MTLQCEGSSNQCNSFLLHLYFPFNISFLTKFKILNIVIPLWQDLEIQFFCFASQISLSDKKIFMHHLERLPFLKLMICGCLLILLYNCFQWEREYRETKTCFLLSFEGLATNYFETSHPRRFVNRVKQNVILYMLGICLNYMHSFNTFIEDLTFDKHFPGC